MAAVSSKPIKEARFVQHSLLYFGCRQPGVGAVRDIKAHSPHPPTPQLPDSTPPVGGGLVKGFIDRGRGCLQKQQSALTVILKLVTSGLASFSFAVLGAVNLSSRVSLFPFL